MNFQIWEKMSEKTIRKCLINERIYEYQCCAREFILEDWPDSPKLKYLGYGEIYSLNGINFKENTYKHSKPDLFHFWKLEKEDDNV